MEKPSEILRRARVNRRANTHRQKRLPEKMLGQASKLQQAGSHANYSALMRSHDRARSRHIGSQAGGSDA